MPIPTIDLTALKNGLPASEASATTPLNGLQTAVNNLIAGDLAWDQLNYALDTKTIASDAITITKTYNKVDTEAAAATDNLSTINGGNDGDFLILVAANVGRVITVKHGVGNIQTSNATDFVLSSTRATLFFRSGSVWSDVTVPPAPVNPGIFNARLTLTSVTPVTTADVTAATIVYVTPFRGNQMALYTANGWQLFTFTEILLSIAGLAANTNYDVFVYYNGTAVTAELQAWTNDTTRAVSLTPILGVYTKTTDSTRRYAGTFRTTGTIGQTEDSVLKRYVWNYYNRQNRRLVISDTTTHAYTTAAWRNWNASSAIRCEFVIGLVEDGFTSQVSGRWGGAAGEVAVGAALNSVVTPSALTDPYVDWLGATIATFGDAMIQIPRLGYNFIQGMEFGSSGNTFYLYRSSALILG